MLIGGAGSPNVSTTTSFPNGTYTLTGFGSGAYTVTPTKTGGQNSITSFDAARISQHVTGNGPLMGNQLIVADVSNNGSVTSFDASQLARYTISAPPYGSTGSWRFLPVDITYSSVSGNILGEDYTALLMGEVSGNWTDTGTRSTSAGGPERAAAIKLPEIVSPVDKEILIPVNVQRVANKGVISYEFDLIYDPKVIQPEADPVDVAGTASRGFFFLSNANEPGLLRVVMYGPKPIDGNGVLLNLRFTAVGASGSLSPLVWERFTFNEGDPHVITSAGQIKLF